MYLSIDLDFWNYIDFSDMRRTLELVAASGKLRQVCDNHKLMLKSIHASGCRDIVNVDTHSDIVSSLDMDYWTSVGNGLCCGTWANNVNPEQRGTFRWIHPRFRSVRCDSRRDNGTPFSNPRSIGWDKVRFFRSYRFPTTLIDEADDIGIAISYYWIRNHTKPVVRQMLKEIFGKLYRQMEFSCW